jgi:hypothetical protein
MIETGNVYYAVRMPSVLIIQKAWGSVVVKALRYKSEGPAIDSPCRRGFFRGI